MCATLIKSTWMDFMKLFINWMKGALYKCYHDISFGFPQLDDSDGSSSREVNLLLIVNIQNRMS